MSSVRVPPKEPCWLLWELFEGKMYLRAVNTSETLTSMQKRLLVKEAKDWDRPALRLYIEKSQMNHLYGRTER